MVLAVQTGDGTMKIFIVLIIWVVAFLLLAYAAYKDLPS